MLGFFKLDILEPEPVARRHEYCADAAFGKRLCRELFLGGAVAQPRKFGSH